MADNYLERRMEDLRAGRLSGSPARKDTVSPRKGCLQVPFPPRRVLVTGGASGIGLAVVRGFLKTGSKVAVFDIDGEKGERLAHDEGVRFHHVDISDAVALEKALDNLLGAWRDIDIIVSNAGMSDFVSLADGEIKDFDRIIDTNLRPAYIMARKWAIHRKTFPATGSFGGRFIIVSSTRHIQSESGTEAYSASKGALASLSHSLMMSLSGYRITVNCVSPGWIYTGDVSELSEEDHSQHPSGRVGTPEDISRVCLFLSLPDNDFINGADIVVDGGMTRKMIYC